MPEGTWLFGRYRLEPAARRLHVDGRAREVDARAMAVLECLLLRANRIVPRATLIAEAWPEADAVFDSAVSKVMRRLRTAMGDGHGHVLQTIYGEGYRLALPATHLPAPPRGAEWPAAAASADPDALMPPDMPAQPAPAIQPSEAADRPGHFPAPTRRSAWLARLPWIIATASTSLAGWLAWLLLARTGAA